MSEPLTKEDLLSALNQVIPPIVKGIAQLQEELAKRPTRQEVRQIVREEISGLKIVLPDREMID